MVKMDTQLLVKERPDSVTIKETSKGDLYFEVKVYGYVNESLEDLVAKAGKTYDKLILIRQKNDGV